MGKKGNSKGRKKLHSWIKDINGQLICHDYKLNELLEKNDYRQLAPMFYEKIVSPSRKKSVGSFILYASSEDIYSKFIKETNELDCLMRNLVEQGGTFTIETIFSTFNKMERLIPSIRFRLEVIQKISDERLRSIESSLAANQNHGIVSGELLQVILNTCIDEIEFKVTVAEDNVKEAIIEVVEHDHDDPIDMTITVEDLEAMYEVEKSYLFAFLSFFVNFYSGAES